MLGLEDQTAGMDPLAVFRHLCAISSTVAAGPVWSPVGSERDRDVGWLSGPVSEASWCLFCYTVFLRSESRMPTWSKRQELDSL